MGVKADPEQSEIKVDGVRVKAESKVYYLLNKPSGVLSATADEYGRPTVVGLIPGEKRRMYPVGRLDEDTEGLILLTNDGELANVLTHPRYGVPKTYSARLRGAITRDAVENILRGIRLEDGVAKAEQVYVTHRGKDESHARLVMREGRNYIVRRMLAKAGFPAKRLRCDRIAFLTLHGLGRRGHRPLTRLEVARLYEYAKRADRKSVEGFDLPPEAREERPAPPSRHTPPRRHEPPRGQAPPRRHAPPARHARPRGQAPLRGHAPRSGQARHESATRHAPPMGQAPPRRYEPPRGQAPRSGRARHESATRHAPPRGQAPWRGQAPPTRHAPPRGQAPPGRTAGSRPRTWERRTEPRRPERRPGRTRQYKGKR